MTPHPYVHRRERTATPPEPPQLAVVIELPVRHRPWRERESMLGEVLEAFREARHGRT